MWVKKVSKLREYIKGENYGAGGLKQCFPSLASWVKVVYRAKYWHIRFHQNCPHAIVRLPAVIADTGHSTAHFSSIMSWTADSIKSESFTEFVERLILLIWLVIWWGCLKQWTISQGVRLTSPGWRQRPPWGEPQKPPAPGPCCFLGWRRGV